MVEKVTLKLQKQSFLLACFVGLLDKQELQNRLNRQNVQINNSRKAF